MREKKHNKHSRKDAKSQRKKGKATTTSPWRAPCGCELPCDFRVYCYLSGRKSNHKATKAQRRNVLLCNCVTAKMFIKWNERNWFIDSIIHWINSFETHYYLHLISVIWCLNTLRSIPAVHRLLWYIETYHRRDRKKWEKWYSVTSKIRNT